jgi:hypothetical protein
VAIYWNGKLNISDADEKKRWVNAADEAVGSMAAEKLSSLFMSLSTWATRKATSLPPGAPVASQILDGLNVVETALKGKMGLRGREAVVELMKAAKGYFNLDAPPFPSLIRKYGVDAIREAAGRFFATTQAGMGDTHPFGSPLRRRRDYGSDGESEGRKLPSEDICTGSENNLRVRVIADRIARKFVGLEFDTKKQMDDYKREHTVRRDTKMTVKPEVKKESERKEPVKEMEKKPEAKKTKKEEEKERIEQEKDEWFDHPFDGERILYHGTSKKNWEKIQKTGYLEPHLADNSEDGKAVWLTSDKKEAEDYKNKGGVIIGIKQKDAMSFKHHRYLSLPSKVIKEWKENPKKWGSIDELKAELHHFDFVVHEKIPLKHIHIVDDSKVKKAVENNLRVRVIADRIASKAKEFLGE